MASARLSFLIVAVLAIAALAAAKDFNGHQVVRFQYSTERDVQALLNIIGEQVDVWSHNPVRKTIDINLHSSTLEVIKKQLPQLTDHVFISDLSSAIQESQMMNEMSRLESTMDDEDYFKAYHSYEEIMNWLNQTHIKYPQLTQLEKIGETFEGRDIMAIRITSNRKTKSSTPKPSIVYNSLQHAREWISGATTQWIIYQLTTGYGVRPEVTAMVDAIEWVIIPVVNVDGYVYTWAKNGNRLWRKNRRPLPNTSCMGVDLNRNWAYHFEGGSAGKCEEIYPGPSPFSEPESSALASFIKNNPNTVGYIDFHAYSELFMWPWAWTSAPPSNAAEYDKLGFQMVSAIEAVNGVQYTYGQVYTTIYPAYGSSIDWTLGVANVSLSFVIEGRDTGRYGFLLPPAQIIPSGKETFEAVIKMGQWIMGRNN